MTASSALALGQEGHQLKLGLKRQLSVILALIFKEWRANLQTSKFGVVFVFAEPIVFLSAISIVLLVVGRTQFDGVHILLFVPAGVIPFLIFRRSMMSTPKAVGKNEGLMDYPQVKPIDAVIAAFIFQMWLLFLAASLLMFLLWWFLDLVPSMPRPLEALGVMAVFLVGCFGLCLLVAVYATLYEFVQRTLEVLRRPIIIISGVIWPIDNLPTAAREVLAWNPLVHVIAYIRHYSLGMPMFPEADVGYICYSALLLLGAAFICYYANRWKLVQER
jgi:capsular polysaccharide transport system permease protein